MSFTQDIPDLSPEMFEQFAGFIHRHASIHLKDHKITLLSNRLRKRLKALNLSSFEEYYEKLQDPGFLKQELGAFLEVVTTNESYFWRTVQNFEMLKEHLLPDLLTTFTDKNLKFWSAGCSTGEEPYNLAIELTESMKKHSIFDFSILATDISARVIDFANEGRYNGRKIEKIPPFILNRYFRPDREREGYYRVRSDIKAKINFETGNLFKVNPPAMHCIFCRNVMIYFNRDDQQTIVRRFYNILKPGGYLVIGHSESLHMMQTEFQPVHFPNGVAYKKPL